MPAGTKEKFNKAGEFDFDQTTVHSQKLDNVLGIPANIDFKDIKDFNNVQKEIGEFIETIENSSSKKDMIAKMTKWEMSINGQFDSSTTSYSWEGSCKAVATLTASHRTTIVNSIVRTLTVEPYFMVDIRGEKDKELLIQDFTNDRAKYDFDYEVFVREMADITVDTPAAIIFPEWVREIRKKKDYEFFEKVEDFQTKYTDAEEAGMAEGEYQKELKVVKDSIENNGFYVSYYQYDVVGVNRPFLRVIHPVDFGMYPFDCLNVNLAKMCYHTVRVTFDDIVRGEKSGEYYAGSADKIRVKYGGSGESDDVKKAQEVISGVSDDSILAFKDQYRNKVYDIKKGYVKLILAEDKKGLEIEEDYEFAFVRGEDVLLRVANSRYNVQERNYFFAEILPTSRSIWGYCIPGLLEHPQELVSTLIRQAVDSNTISNVPVFKGRARDKLELERTYQTTKIYPSKIFWLTDPTALEQFKFSPINILDYLRLIQYIVQDAETRTGASRSLSGQPLSEDPEAPGVKTAMLIQQSNFMVNQYIANLRPVLGKIMLFVLYMYYYQLFRDKITIRRIEGTTGREEVADIGRDDLSFIEGLTNIYIKNQKVDDNQQLRLSEYREDLSTLMAIADINQNPYAKRILIKNYLMKRENYTMDEIEQIITPVEEIQRVLNEKMEAEQNAAMLGQERENLQQRGQETAEQFDTELQQKMQQSFNQVNQQSQGGR